jgi:hypothetical protein
MSASTAAAILAFSTHTRQSRSPLNQGNRVKKCVTKA